MKFTLVWLKDHLETSASLSEIIETLPNLGLEVEHVEDPAVRLKGFIVADVLACEKHPNADRLHVCRINDGSGQPLQVVCGAANVRAGMKVAFARVGQVIPISGDALKKGRIRDVDSYGMLCSAHELMIGEEGDGILDLSTNSPAGSDLASAMSWDDPVIELSITPNRGDCFGVRGIARELAAAGLGTLKPLSYTPIKGDYACPIQVSIKDAAACDGYVGRVITGVHNGASPEWVQARLKAVGLRPISALVDVTNYLAYDLGRPLHVFDTSHLTGPLHVRFTREGEQLDALNEKTYTFPAGFVAIADDAGVQALGGIMGGVATGCTPTTTSVFIECAHFDPVLVAKAGQALSILSDARTRFERGVDPASLMTGLDAATQLILSWCGGTPSSPAEAHSRPYRPQLITLQMRTVHRLSGMVLSSDEIQAYLEKIGCQVEAGSSETVRVTTPSWRHDLVCEADLVEEILRLKGYDTIPTTPLPSIPLSCPSADTVTSLRRVMAQQGLSEVVTWSFVSEAHAKLFSTTLLPLSNPISQDMGIMRPSLLASLLTPIQNNQARGQEGGGFFEIGSQYAPGPEEKRVLAGIRYGLVHGRHWVQSTREVDVFDSKGDLEALLAWFGTAAQIDDQAPAYYHPGRSATLRQGAKVLGFFGELHPNILTACDLKGPLIAFEAFLDAFSAPKRIKGGPPLSPYQPVIRDFAFVVDTTIRADGVLQAVRKADKQLIEDVTIFDVYEGNKVPAGKKSLALQVKLQPHDRTLTEADINKTSTAIIEAVKAATGGVLRQ